MHSFVELINHGTAFTLQALQEAQDNTIEALQTSGATRHVKALQMIQLQKVTLAVGMFSIFDATLQGALGCKGGFAEAEKLLEQAAEKTLVEAFRIYRLAVNVLKHGRGSSYDKLLVMPGPLPFRIKEPGQNFFFEGDVSEVDTLVEVSDGFILACADVIQDMAEAIKRARPGIYF
jgi:hypothetical protein